MGKVREKGFMVSKVQVQKAKTTVRVGSDCAFTNYSIPLESGPASGAYRGSLLWLVTVSLLEHQMEKF